MASVTEQLKDLAGLFKEGLITRDEFDEQKQMLLAEHRQRVSSPPAGEPASPPPEGADLVGQHIGEYHLERKLGEGGMGTVYLGTHQTLDQRVAVKVLDAALARNAEVRTRFIQEANIQVKLQHPGIVRVLTASTQGDHLALVMEYVEGISLEQALERHGRLPLAKMAPLMEQVLAAVGHAHAQGVVHRDLKPSNIMVQPDGVARVMDFGIAKVVGGAKLTRTGTLMGTALYMSPEQVLGRSDVDHRTDIYSLGVTFYEALTGRPPFEGSGDEGVDSDFLIKQAHVQTDPPDPRRFLADLPGHLAGALLGAMAKDPGDRFEGCGEFGLALRQAKGQVEHASPSAGTAASPPVGDQAGPPTNGPVGKDSGHSSPGATAAERAAVQSSPGAVSAERAAVKRGELQIRGQRFVALGPGAFDMGSPEEEEGRLDEETRHPVTLTRGFALSATPVTQEFYRQVTGKSPSFFAADQNPVERVNWMDAVLFCNSLSDLEGLPRAYRAQGESVVWDIAATGFRLPTEAEWEYAARADRAFVFAGSDQPSEVAWFAANSGDKPHAVGNKRPNPWGLLDMSGNVWEWVWDRYDEHPDVPVTDPTGADAGAFRVMRGGSWTQAADRVRVAARARVSASNLYYDVGFRVASSLP